MTEEIPEYCQPDDSDVPELTDEDAALLPQGDSINEDPDYDDE